MLCYPHCSQLSTMLNNIVTPDSGSTILFNIVDKCEQCGQHNIVQSGLIIFTRVGWKQTCVNLLIIKRGLN